MQSVFYQNHLNSYLWKVIVRRILKRAGGKCERCGAWARLEVHHKHYRTLGQERDEDLEALCKPCHDEADSEREDETWQRRVDAWARKVWGSCWEDYRDFEEAEEAFQAWLERKGLAM